MFKGEEKNDTLNAPEDMRQEDKRGTRMDGCLLMWGKGDKLAILLPGANQIIWSFLTSKTRRRSERARACHHSGRCYPSFPSSCHVRWIPSPAVHNHISYRSSQHIAWGSTYIRTIKSSPAEANMPGSVGFQDTALTHPEIWPSKASTRLPFSLCQM